MALYDVPDLVPQSSGQFVEVICTFDQTTIHIHETARQREGIDLLGVYDVEMPVEVGAAGFAGDRFAQILDVRAHSRLGDDWQLRVDLVGILPAQGHFLVLGYGTSDEYDNGRNRDPETNPCTASTII